MYIHEIFYSIQGEGNWAGLPNIFIRTAGCNLRCSFCDTPAARLDGSEISIKKILATIKKYPCRYICLTGGEPLLQSEISELIDVFLKKKYSLCIETNGSMPIEKIIDHQSLMISLDIKCPSSLMHEKMHFDNLAYLRKNDQLKFIIDTQMDYRYAKKVMQTYNPCCTIFFQPVWGSDPHQLATWILNDGLPVKLGLQLHKIIFGTRDGV